MGIFATIGKKNVTKIIDSSIKGIDKLIFTNEEKAEFNKGMADAVLEYSKSSMGENTVRSITRRFIAFAIMGVYLVSVIASGIVYIFNQPHGEFLFSLVKYQSSMAIMVAAFYFGGYYASKFIGSDRTAKSRKKNSANG